MAEERKIVAVYQYKDEKGEVVYEIYRTEPKGFGARRPDGKGGHIYNLSGVEPLPYRIDEIQKLPYGEIIFACEGEKDANALWALGIPATTNHGGAGKWTDKQSAYLRGRHVGILPDNDEAGRKGAKIAAESLYNVNAPTDIGTAPEYRPRIKIVNLPNLPPKGDVSDWLDAGNDPRLLYRMFDEAKDYEPEEKWTKKAEVVSMDEVEEKDIEYVWPKRFPTGMISLVAGDPGMGKSGLTLYIAATVSRGGEFADGSKAPLGSVVLISVENNLATVVVKRLKKMDADLSKIKALRGILIKDDNGEVISDNFNLLRDTGELEKVIKSVPDCKLVIIDPLSDYFGNADTHRDAVVRRVLSRLSVLAERCNVAIVGVMHLNKGNFNKASYRLNGSIGFLGTARMVWGVTPDPDNPESSRRILSHMKTNIGEKIVSLAFSIEGERVVFEQGTVDISAEQAFAQQDGIEAPQRKRCVDWLKEILSEVDSMPSKEILEMAKEEGFKETTLAKARKELGVKCFPDFDEEGSRFWSWKLPKTNENEKKLPSLEETLKKLQKMKEKTKLFPLKSSTQ